VSSPNTTAFVADEETVVVLSVTDQILQGIRYLGNVFPSILPQGTQDDLRELTRTAGLALAAEGYRGFCGLDFVVSQDQRCYAVDLNPRKQGGLLCNILASDRADSNLMTSLLAIEAGHEDEWPSMVQINRFENTRSSLAWAQQKIRPPSTPAVIREEFVSGAEDRCFQAPPAAAARTFFPRGSRVEWGSLLGHAVVTGLERSHALMNLSDKVLEARNAVEATNTRAPSGGRSP